MTAFARLSQICTRVHRAWLGAFVTAVSSAMLIGSAPARAATTAPYLAICRLPPSEIHFNNLPQLGEFDGSQMRFARTDVGYYPPGLGGLSLTAVSAALPINFPVEGSRIRFFYLQDNQQKYGGYADGLVGCLYFSMNGKSYVLSNKFEQEGNATPIVVSMFTLDLTHGIGQTLFVVVRYDAWRMDETVYNLAVYGLKGITEKASSTDWSSFGLWDFVAKVFGDNSWNVVGDETPQSVHAYADKASIAKRLKELGYLK